jgi:hypothetical protein
LLDNIPKINISFKSREECDDDYVVFEGGKVDPEAGKGHGHGHDHGTDNGNELASTSEKDLRLYNASMYKLKLVSFVSTFFIVA